MAKKTLSFAEKAARGKAKQDWKYVKYVKSVRSEKTGHWRFNETMVRINGGETLDAALKRVEEQKMALDIEMPVIDESSPEKVVEAVDESETDEVLTDKDTSESVSEAVPVTAIEENS